MRTPKTRERTQDRHQSGYLLIVTLVFFSVLFVLSVAFVESTVVYTKFERHAVASAQALALAEAGIDKAVYELNQSASYTGESDTALDPGTFTVSVSTVDGNTKAITATGYVPNDSSPAASRTVKATVAIDSDTASFRFGVQVGEGGLVMDNNAQINGSIFSNGNVSGSGIITGDASVAVGTSAVSDQEWTVQNADFAVGSIAAREDAAQSSIPSTGGTLNKVGLYLKKVGNPGDLTFRLVTESGANPSKTTLGSGTIAASLVTANYGWIDGYFASSPTLSSGTKYWLMLNAPAVNASNYYVWGQDTADGYVSNTGKYSANWNAGSPVWNAAGGDFDFKTYMNGVTTSLSGVTVQGNATSTSMSSCTVSGHGYYGTNSGCTIGTSHPNSTAAAPQAMPISDSQIADWKAAAEAGGSQGDTTINGTVSLGPRKILGNLVVNGTLTMTGPVWVTGTVTVGNNAAIRAGLSVGNASVALVTDGTAAFSNNVIVAGNGNAGSFVLVLSTSNSASALAIGNNVNGGMYYTSAGTIDVSNNASTTQLTGYAIHLNNNAVVNYASGLQSLTFSSGPGGSWAFVPGTYVIVE